jgi:hypothetical protein
MAVKIKTILLVIALLIAGTADAQVASPHNFPHANAYSSDI